jgi:hypothetical protein
MQKVKISLRCFGLNVARLRKGHKRLPVISHGKAAARNVVQNH